MTVFFAICRCRPMFHDCTYPVSRSLNIEPRPFTNAISLCVQTSWYVAGDAWNGGNGDCSVRLPGREAGFPAAARSDLRLAGVVAGRRREHVRALVEVRDVPAAADDGLIAPAEDRRQEAVAEVRRPRETHARRQVHPVGPRRDLGAREHRVLHAVQLAGLKEPVDGPKMFASSGNATVPVWLNGGCVHLVPQAVVQREVAASRATVLHEQASEPRRRPVLRETPTTSTCSVAGSTTPPVRTSVSRPVSSAYKCCAGRDPRLQPGHRRGRKDRRDRIARRNAKRIAGQAQIAARSGAVERPIAPLRVAVISAELERVIALRTIVSVSVMVVM